MEIIGIEKKTFNQMMMCFESFVVKVDAFCIQHEEKRLKKWLDNQDVCLLYNISARTLQTLRDNGTLAYSQINRKFYYKPDDVKSILNKKKNNHE